MIPAPVLVPRERGILFTAEMVRAIQRGKTETRRLSCRYQVGDLLWVKEAWRVSHFDADNFEDGQDRCSLYLKWAADGSSNWIYCDEVPSGCRVPKAAVRGNVSPLFMPKWASRIWLEVTAVRKEALQDITEEGARAEGFESRAAFAALWDRIHGEGAWASNPEVYAIEFRRVK